MLYACDRCRYLFEADQKPQQCPDCGKFTVRQATPSEQEEYTRRETEREVWE